MERPEERVGRWDWLTAAAGAGEGFPLSAKELVCCSGWVGGPHGSRAVDESRIERSQGIGIELTTTCRARLISRYYSVKVPYPP